MRRYDRANMQTSKTDEVVSTTCVLSVSFCRSWQVVEKNGWYELVWLLESARSQGSGTRDNFDELHSNTSLTRLVVLKRELVHDLTSVLAGVLHSVHTGRLLCSCIVEEGDPQVGCHVELVKSRVSRCLVW